jgi:hypothetical protein
MIYVVVLGTLDGSIYALNSDGFSEPGKTASTPLRLQMPSPTRSIRQVCIDTQHPQIPYLTLQLRSITCVFFGFTKPCLDVLELGSSILVILLATQGSFEQTYTSRVWLGIFLRTHTMG